MQNTSYEQIPPNIRKIAKMIANSSNPERTTRLLEAFLRGTARDHSTAETQNNTERGNWYASQTKCPAAEYEDAT